MGANQKGGTPGKKTPGIGYAEISAQLSWHRKVLALPDDVRLAAYGFYCAACAYCQNNRTDGVIQKPELVAVFPCGDDQRARVVDALVKVHLFDDRGGAYAVHDYLDHNRSAAEIADSRRRMVEGGRKGGSATRSDTQSPPLKPTLEGGTEKSRAERSEEKPQTSQDESTPLAHLPLINW